MCLCLRPCVHVFVCRVFLGYFVFSLCVLSCVFLCFCTCADVVVLACQNVFERFNGLVYALICAGCSGSVFVCSSVDWFIRCLTFERQIPFFAWSGGAKGISISGIQKWL